MIFAEFPPILHNVRFYLASEHEDRAHTDNILAQFGDYFLEDAALELDELLADAADAGDIHQVLQHTSHGL